MPESDKAIIKTLLYSDIFNFPLTKEEVWRYLLSREPIEKADFEQALQRLVSSEIYHKDGFYCLKGRAQCIEKRKKLIPQTEKKLRIARKAAYYLSYIPTVSFIGISGGLALGNAQKDDDIDFFIITKPHTLFITRLWALALLDFLQLRRKRGGKQSMNKICINFLMDETRLLWPSGKRDIYIAHEIMQVRPLFERDGMYAKFLKANQWIRKLFPNMPKAITFRGSSWYREYYSLKVLHKLGTITFCEAIVRIIQKAYMKKHQTTEVISNSMLAFHPRDYHGQTLDMLKLRLQQYGLLTNK